MSNISHRLANLGMLALGATVVGTMVWAAKQLAGIPEIPSGHSDADQAGERSIYPPGTIDETEASKPLN